MSELILIAYVCLMLIFAALEISHHVRDFLS